MARGPRIKLTKDQLRWNITNKEKELCAKTMIQILKSKDEKTSNRDRNGAVKNLMLMNAQDIDLAKHEDPQPNQLTIRIEEVDASPLVEKEEEKDTI